MRMTKVLIPSKRHRVEKKPRTRSPARDDNYMAGGADCQPEDSQVSKTL